MNWLRNSLTRRYVINRTNTLFTVQTPHWGKVTRPMRTSCFLTELLMESSVARSPSFVATTLGTQSGVAARRPAVEKTRLRSGGRLFFGGKTGRRCRMNTLPGSGMNRGLIIVAIETVE